MFKFVFLSAIVAIAHAGLISSPELTLASGPALGAPLLGRVSVNPAEVNVVKQQIVVDQPEIRYRAVPTIVQSAPVVQTVQVQAPAVRTVQVAAPVQTVQTVAAPQLQTVQVAAPAVRTVQVAAPQLQTVQTVAAPQLQTIQVAAPALRTVQLSPPAAVQTVNAGQVLGASSLAVQQPLVSGFSTLGLGATQLIGTNQLIGANQLIGTKQLIGLNQGLLASPSVLALKK